MMPQRLKIRQEKIQEKRKKTPWREFVMEIVSRYNVSFYKQATRVDGFPSTDRLHLTTLELFASSRGGDFPIYGDTFFETFGSLIGQHPFPHIHHIGNNENALYASMIYGAQNVYLSTEVIFASNVLYSAAIKDNSDTVLSSINVVTNNANIYMSNTVRNSYQVFYSKGILDSSDIWFSSNLIGCKECMQCTDLQHASYMIQNQQYQADEYYKKKDEILKQKGLYGSLYAAVSQPGQVNSHQSTGIGVIDAQGVENGYYISRLSNSRNVFFAGGGEGNSDFFDTIIAGVPSGESYYGVVGAAGSHYYCCFEVTDSSHIFYSMFIENCSHCLGCIGLQNKSYCIFNTQYTKEERYNKVDEIFTQMEVDGTLGQFFPGSMNPFYFNDTAAYLIDDSFTKEEVTAKGYLWRDEPIKVDIPAGATVVKTSELDQYEGWKDSLRPSDTSLQEGGKQWRIDPEILKVIIQDEEGNVYRIVQMEYDFLMKYALPLPRKHWLDRMKENFRVS